MGAAGRITLEEGYLISNILGAVAYGINVALVVILFSSLLARWNNKTFHPNWILVTASVVLFSAATVHLALFTDTDAKATRFAARQIPPGSAYTVISKSGYTFRQSVVFTLLNVLGDIVLLYRCWLLWRHRWYLLIFPALLLATAACLAGIMLSMMRSFKATSESDLHWMGKAPHFSTASLSLSLLMTFLTNGLIAYRLYQIIRPCKRVWRYYMALVMVLESGVLFCAAQLTYIVLVATMSSFEVMVALLAQIYCMAPQLIITRVAMGISTDEIPTHGLSAFRWADGSLAGTDEEAATGSPTKCNVCHACGGLIDRQSTADKGDLPDVRQETRSDSRPPPPLCQTRSASFDDWLFRFSSSRSNHDSAEGTCNSATL